MAYWVYLVEVDAGKYRCSWVSKDLDLLGDIRAKYGHNVSLVHVWDGSLDQKEMRLDVRRILSGRFTVDEMKLRHAMHSPGFLPYRGINTTASPDTLVLVANRMPDQYRDEPLRYTGEGLIEKGDQKMVRRNKLLRDFGGTCHLYWGTDDKDIFEYKGAFHVARVEQEEENGRLVFKYVLE